MVSFFAQNWFRASNNEAANNKRNEPESNGLQKDVKNCVPGKKRGRKPKERPLEMTSIPAEILSFTPAPVQIPPQTVITASETFTSIINAPITPPIPADRGSPAQSRDTQPPIKKRSKPKKAPTIE